MLSITIPSENICSQPRIEENIYVRAMFVIVAIQREVSLKYIYDPQNRLSPNNFYNRPIQAWISMIEQ